MVLMSPCIVNTEALRRLALSLLVQATRCSDKVRQFHTNLPACRCTLYDCRVKEMVGREEVSSACARCKKFLE
jgi:hypothetical protein